jgi:hypothetical protein
MKGVCVCVRVCVCGGGLPLLILEQERQWRGRLVDLVCIQPGCLRRISVPVPRRGRFTS